jgi:hypothetical protein
VRNGSGGEEKVDIRTLPFFRFESNEAHTEGLYGMVFAGNNQQGDPFSKVEDLRRIDRTGPDVRHPHIVRDAKIWQVHYGMRPQVPEMLLEHVHIEHATYGIYRPALENHVYRDITIAEVTSEPFNRGMDDASTQTGRLTVDGLTFLRFPNDSHIPLIQMSDNNATGEAESHFRNVNLVDRKDGSRRALVNRGGGARTPQLTERGVPCLSARLFWTRAYREGGHHTRHRSCGGWQRMAKGGADHGRRIARHRNARRPVSQAARSAGRSRAGHLHHRHS